MSESAEPRLAKVTTTVSLFSNKLSSITETSIVADVSPAAMVILRASAVKSSPSAAVPSTVKFTTVAWSDGADKVIVNCPSLVGSPAEGSVAAIETVAVSSSAIRTVDEFKLLLTVTSASSVPVSVTMTVSVSSRMPSSSTLTSIVALV